MRRQKNEFMTEGVERKGRKKGCEFCIFVYVHFLFVFVFAFYFICVCVEKEIVHVKKKIVTIFQLL